MTRRELVRKTLEFENFDQRVPLDMWTLPWAETHYPDTMKKLRKTYNRFDIAAFPDSEKKYRIPPRVKGDPYTIGTYTDEWGVMWDVSQAGIWGQVKHPIVPGEDENWDDVSKVHIPEELLTIDKSTINAFCASTDQFVISSDLVRPFERLQFIRGSQNTFIDIAEENEGMLKMLRRIHEFNCELFEVWGDTDVDGLWMMDDWGSQRSLLINPETWRKMIKPMYKDYKEIAVRHGKKLFFHSDGYTLDIIPELIDIGFDAANLQIFCIGIEKLAPFKGKLTFWGEMDRQHKLVSATPEEIESDVAKVYDTLWDNGGLIGQCEFGAGANPSVVENLYESSSRVHLRKK